MTVAAGPQRRAQESAMGNGMGWDIFSYIFFISTLLVTAMVPPIVKKRSLSVLKGDFMADFRSSGNADVFVAQAVFTTAVGLLLVLAG